MVIAGPKLDYATFQRFNFGRPVAVALVGVILGIGVIGPTFILGLLLR